MKFKIGDQVMIDPTPDQLESEFFESIAGLTGQITEIYSEEYSPNTKMYEVTLDQPTELNDGSELRVVDGLLAEMLAPINDESEKTKTFEAFNESREEARWYYGIADCHGIESFVEEPSRERWNQIDRLHNLGLSPEDSRKDSERLAFGGNLSMMSLRCAHNQQRHPVIYRALLTEEGAEEVNDAISRGEYEEALHAIKNFALEIQLARGHGSNPEKRWNMIPNPNLDPMHG